MLAKGSFTWVVAALMFAIITRFGANITSSHTLHAISSVGFGITLLFITFFRDPSRKIVECSDCALSPADGKVIDIKESTDHKYITVCIFMNIYNVHVNRAPLSGVVKNIEYKRGSYLPAFIKKSEKNERNIITISTKYGDIVVTQIAGTVTRRIVSYVYEGKQIEKGERIGMIKFGSRVDITLPKDFKLSVKKGDSVRAGKTVIATRIRGYLL
ncbi:MAG: phosphatidylserine decarboxylase [Methanosarcinales archaeon]